MTPTPENDQPQRPSTERRPLSEASRAEVRRVARGTKLRTTHTERDRCVLCDEELVESEDTYCEACEAKCREVERQQGKVDQ